MTSEREEDLAWLRWIISYYNDQIAGLQRERRIHGVKVLTAVRDRYQRFLGMLESLSS